MDYRDYKLLGNEPDYWWFRAKRELITNFLRKEFKKKGKPLLILNVGCGFGEDISTFEKYGSVISIDISKDAVSFLKKQKKKIYLMDITKLDITKLNINKKFDVVICSDLLEHVKDDVLAVKNIFDCLNDEGLLIGTVPAHPILFGHMDKYAGHYRRYSKYELKKILLKNFSSTRIYSWNTLLFIPLSALKIIKKMFVKGEQCDFLKLSPFLNNVFYKILSFDNNTIKNKWSLPLGISFVFLCRKGHTAKVHNRK